MDRCFITKLFVVVCFLGMTVLAKKNTNRKLLQDVTDIKEFKKVLRTRTNVLAAFASNEKAASGWMDIISDTAFEMKGLATIVFVSCADAKKMCKKLKVSPPPVLLRHYKDGEFNKDYDRLKTVKSMVKFLRDPTGDIPWDEDAGSQDVLHIENTKSFTKLLTSEKKPILTMFYAPWCGHCKRMKPEFAEAATELKEDAVLVGMDVDNPDSQSIRTTYNITGFPTILYFENGRKKYDYGGERTKDGIIEWMNDPQPPKEPEKEEEWSDQESEVVHLTDETFDPYLLEHNSVLVMFYAPWCGHCKKAKPEFSGAAEELKDELKAAFAAMDCTVDTNRPICETFEIQGFPTLKYLNYGKNPEPYSGGREKADFIRFMQEKIDPDSVVPTPPPPPEEDFWLTLDGGENVQQLGSDFDEFISDKEVLVMFYAPWCGHCKMMKPAYSEAATRAKEMGLSGVFAAVDATVNSQVSGQYGVKGFPTIKLFKNGEMAADYAGDRSTDDMLTFIQNSDREVPKPPAVAKWSDEPSSVNHLTGDTFSSFMAENRNVLTMFYAPWCGHCKQAKPHFTAAADKLKDNPNNKLAAVDCTEDKDICTKYDVAGYPTFKFFQNGELGEPYSSGRDEDSFVNFMSSLSPSTSRKDGEL